MKRKVVVLATLAVAFAVSAASAQTVRPVLQFPKEVVSSVTIDDAGSVVYAVSSTNQFGVNPSYGKQIVRWDPTTGIGTPITDYEEGVETVSVSDDGTWLAFVTAADLLGTNHDESTEIYVMHPDGTGLAQLTFTTVPSVESRGIRTAVISGSGNRIAFLGDINPLGTNSANAMALFVIDRNGANLRQLRTDALFSPEKYRQTDPYTSVVPDFPRLDISDDGSKVVFVRASGFTGINADGTAIHTFSGTSSFPGGIRISGNGAKVVYTSVSPAIVRARTFDGNPGTIVTLGNGERPSITDDATQVYFYRYSDATGSTPGIYRIASTGGAPTMIAPNVGTVCLAGSGNRIVGFGTELIAMDNAGGNLQQLTTTVLPHDRSVFAFAMSLDGHMISFQSNIDPLGTNPPNYVEYFSYDVDTGQYWQRTDASTPLATYPRNINQIAGDGTVVWDAPVASCGNLPGTNEIHLKRPGTAPSVLTDCPATNFAPEIRQDGDVVAFINQTANYSLLAMNTDGTGLTQVTPPGIQVTWFDRVGVAGEGATTWIAFLDDNYDLFRVKADGSALQQISGALVASNPSVSADGHVVAWLGGSMPSHAFVFDDVTQSIRQIPYDATGDYEGPSVTADGQWVFAHTLNSAGRFNVASGVYDYAEGLRRALSTSSTVLPDATGSRWVMTQSNDPNLTVLLADLNAAPAFVVGKASPTVLSWDPSPFSLRYDVVRGSIANLSIAGSTVSLGPVSCLEDDSPDAHTKGHGDPVDPAPGQAFFYLYAGSVGFDATAGSYGQGSGGKERVAGAGGCNP